MSSVLKETRKGNISFLKSGQRHRKVCSVVAEASNSETNSFFYQPRNSFDSNERTVFWQKTVTWTKLLPLTFFLQSAASSELWIIGTWRFVSSRFSIGRSFCVFGDNLKNRNSCHRSIFFCSGCFFCEENDSRCVVSGFDHIIWIHFFVLFNLIGVFLFVFGIGSSRKITSCLISCWTVACCLPSSFLAKYFAKDGNTDPVC